MKQQPSSEKERGWFFAAGEEVDHFHVIRRLGRGGMAQVFLARDTKLGRKVALKVVQPRALGSRRAAERFLFEARATARFNHPHIVTIHDVGEHEGMPYVALEYLEGQTLRQRIQQEPPGLKETQRVALAIAEALEAAHAETIIHRDLKPDNVMLGQDGRLRVLDFGLARVVEDAGGEASTPDAEVADTVAADEEEDREQEAAEQQTVQAPFETRGKGVRGTLPYMAPEQWQEKETTGATDVWALGVILYELISGERPYDHRTPSLQAVTVCSPDPAPTLREDAAPAALRELVARCMDKAPADRPAASEVAAALRKLLDDGRQRTSTDESPFRGLLPFDEQHSHLFFGRESEVSALAERLRTEPMVPVVGPSGAGKSSFVQAGLVPRLRERGPLVVLQLRPGPRPFWALATQIVLARRSRSRRSSSSSDNGRRTTGPHDSPLQPNDPEVESLAAQLLDSPLMLGLLLQSLADQVKAQVLLFVDQLEELFTLSEDEAVPRQFVRAICAAADDVEAPVRVVFTLREEFLSRLSEGFDAREALRSVTLLRAPGAETLQAILEQQAGARGYGYDDGLAAAMVAEVHGEVSSLPLLQFACQQLWQDRDRDREILTRKAYDAMGGVAGALAQHADGVLAGLNEAAVEVGRAMLLRLVTGERTRQVMARTEVLEGLGVAAAEMLDRLIEGRLVTARRSREKAHPEVELAHESLISAWARLRRWIEEGQDELVFLEEAGRAAALWVKRGERQEEVWQGEAFEAARRAAESLSAPPPESVRRFLAAGERQTQRLTRRRRVLRGALFGLLSVLVLVFAAATAIVTRQKGEVEQHRGKAEQHRQQSEERHAETLREGAQTALESGEIQKARAKLRGALQTQDSVQARLTWRSLKQQPLVWKSRFGSGSYTVDVSPDGKLVASGGVDRTVYLMNASDGRLHRALRGHRNFIQRVRFGPHNKLLATSSMKELWLWDVASGQRVRTFANAEMAYKLSFSPDGKLLASSHADKKVWLWEVSTGKLAAALDGHGAVVAGLAFSPDGKLLASASNDRTIRLWDVSTLKVLSILEGHTAPVSETAFSPDGKLLASSSHDRTVRLWDVATRKQVRTLKGGRSHIGRLSFSPDGRLLIMPAKDGSMGLWNVRSWKQVRTFGGRGSPHKTVFFPDSKRVVTAGTPAKILDTTLLKAPRLAEGHVGAANDVSFSPDGKLLASASLDSTVMLWDVATQRPVAALKGHARGAVSATFSPDGKLLATTSFKSKVRLWDVDTRRRLATLDGHEGSDTRVSWSPDGKLLASCGRDGKIRLWDVATCKQLTTFESPGTFAFRVDFDPRGKLLASGITNRPFGCGIYPNAGCSRR